MRNVRQPALTTACLVLLAIAIFVNLGAALAQESLAEPGASSKAVIAVHLASGRTLTAALNPRTDAALLWLCFERGETEILRPIRWDRVIWAEVAGDRLPGEELQRLIAQLRQEIPAQPVTPPAQNAIVMFGPLDAKPPPTGGATPKESIGGGTGFQPGNTHGQDGRATSARRHDSLQSASQGRVVSLVIDAHPARWDENVDPDGLLVHVYPLAADGATVPVRGTLSVDLKVQQRSVNMLHEPFVDAGHWAETVQTTDFGPAGAVYRLRYQRIHPEFDDRVMSPGLVHACLSVPGQGTFEASTELTFVRPFSPARDHLQAITRHGYFSGYRYFDNERTDDGRR